MAAAKNPSRITILVLIMISFNSFMVPSEAELYYQVSLINSSGAQTLSATCKITGDQKGKTFTMIPSAKDSFAILLQPEKHPVQVARCSISLGSLFGDFILFDSTRDGSRCPGNNCVWRINEQGLFFLVNNIDFVLEFKWPSSSS